MSRAVGAGRVPARLLVAASLLPLMFGVVAVRPADAVSPGYASYGLTALAAGARTAGDVGAGGGLATLDTASASVSARLDGAPSAAVLAAPYEPGTLARTVVGQANAGSGQALDVPDAEAQFPGSQTSGELTTVPPTDGPASSRGGAATAKATATSAAGTATGQALDVGGVVEVSGATTSVELTGDPAAGKATATGRSTVGAVVVAGVLRLDDVVATASLTADGDRHRPTAELVVGGVSVNGQAVVIGDDGVTAVGTPVVPGQTVADLTEQANAALSAAGISVQTLRSSTASTARGASADSGGVQIRLVSPELPGGLPANRLEVFVGGVSLTETDTLPVPVADVPLGPAPAPLPVASAAGGVTSFLPGTPGSPAIPAAAPPAADAAAPAVAAPAAASAAFTVVGRRLPATAVLAAFAVWQFLSLGTATLYAVVDRRRRLTLLAPRTTA